MKLEDPMTVGTFLFVLLALMAGGWVGRLWGERREPHQFIGRILGYLYTIGFLLVFLVLCTQSPRLGEDDAVWTLPLLAGLLGLLGGRIFLSEREIALSGEE